LKTFASICCLVVALSGVACASPQDDQIRIEELKADAYAKHPSNPVEGAKAANDAIESEVPKVSAQLSPRDAAIYVFIGYYTKNVFAIPEVCASQAVPLPSYSLRFSELHASLIQIAAQSVDTSSLIVRAKPNAIKNATQELERLAASRGTDLPGICKWISANSDELAKGAQFEIIMPRLYKDITQSP